MLLALAFTWTLVALTFIDADTTLLPDDLTPSYVEIRPLKANQSSDLAAMRVTLVEPGGQDERASLP